jgi:predicted ABC-type transport system involved in lysophospholipase L1 biosynthesis ATPase subunit
VPDAAPDAVPSAAIPSPEPPLLQLIDVGRAYPAARGEREPVLRGVSLLLRRGESLAVVGPSGCGKSTLLNIIGGLDVPDSGRVLLEGRDLASLSEPERARVRNRRLGFVFQEHHLLPQCTALENVLLPALAHDRAAEQEARAAELLQRVGLARRLDHRPAQLSGGERQRVALVRALINQPALLLADEPTGSLDQAAAVELADLLVDLNRGGDLAMIVVTHAPGLAQRMGRQATLRDGRLTEPAR